MKFYCTHFDSNYIPHALSLYHSLDLFAGPFKLFMFCMDDESFYYLKELDLVSGVILSHKQIEDFIPNLGLAKKNRSRVEYFYTCSPAICYYVLQNFEQVELITYLDADIYFYSSPKPLYEELGDASVGIIDHRFHWISQRNSRYGKFNVGWINFRRDQDGLNCLTNWLECCINWCYQRLEDGKYADQKYLDIWPEKFKNVRILHNKGANLAIWNIKNYKLNIIDTDVLVDNEKLIFYHFSNLKQISDHVFSSDLSRVLVRTTQLILNKIYLPYVNSLLKYQVNKSIPKKDNYNNKIRYQFKIFSRYIRHIIFPDTIKIK
jgi:hypothetical protein